MGAHIHEEDFGRNIETTSGMRSGQPARLTPADIDFSPAATTEVISAAQKFVIPIPLLKDGEPLVYPEGDPKAGQPITDWKGNPVGDFGLVFFNYKDSCWQAAPGDGSAVIIMNEVTEEQARSLLERIGRAGSRQGDLSRSVLSALLEFSSNLGIRDCYTSDRNFIGQNMTPVTDELIISTRDGGSCGLMKRDSRDIWRAVYVPDAFTFEGPAATPQVFQNGGVLVKKGESVHGIDPGVFMRTYKLRDGTPITDLSLDIKIG